MIVFTVFVILLTCTVVNPTKNQRLFAKRREDWLLDGVGLFFQGILIPALQVTVVYQLYRYLLPNQQATLNLHPLIAIAIVFVFVDYLYYWNHRLFHSSWLWSIHKVHHTVIDMDVLGTSRNTLWTSFLIIYLWIHSLFIYLLQDPTWYVVGVSLTSGLDLWRHSVFSPNTGSIIYSWLSPWLILPQDHAWHHASNGINCNYGANFKFWDKIHGTYYYCDEYPSSLGIKTELSLIQKLFLPF